MLLRDVLGEAGKASKGRKGGGGVVRVSSMRGDEGN